MCKEIRFGLIGCGAIGRLHAKVIQSHSQARLVAVAGKTAEATNAFAEQFGIDAYTDIDAMLKRSDIDAIGICTPSGTHGELALQTAGCGKHAIVEKPMEVSLRKAEAMIRAFREKQLKLSVVSQHRFDSDTVKLKNMIQSGKLGKPIQAQASVHWYRTQHYYDSAAWRGTRALDGGGVLMNQSIHTIDLLQYLMGEIESIAAFTGTLVHQRIDVEDAAVAIVRFKAGGMGTISCSTSVFPGFPSRLELYWENGSALLEGDALTRMMMQETGAANLIQTPSVLKHAGGESNPSSIRQDSHAAQYNDFIHSIVHNKEPLINGEEGIKPLEIIVGAYESAKEGRIVYL